MRIKRRRKYQDIAPDEILIDVQNLPGFERSRLEGRIEKPIERRIFRNFLFGMFVIGFIFFAQLVKLQVVDAESLRARAESNHLTQQTLIAERGFITDRNGEPLALNDFREDLGFFVRSYPLGEAAAQVIGYVSYPKRDDNGNWFQDTSEGLSGIESFFDAGLAGENGAEIRETTAFGDVVSGSTIRPSQNGDVITLSLDAGLQKELYDMIKVRSDESGFIGGSGVIMDIHTGEVYALVSYPSFDPEVLSSGSPRETIAGYVADTRSPFLDRAVSGLYTPGSVVKPIVALAALEEGIISPEKQIYSSGSISVPNPYNPELPSVFRDWKAHGWVDMRDAIAVSSDVYFYANGGGVSGETAAQARIGDLSGLGISKIEEYMRLFGMGSVTDIPLEGESVGVVPNPVWKAETFDGERWFLGNTYHTSIGQYGFQITAIQLARAYTAVANGGVLVNPSIVAGVSGTQKDLGVSEKNIRIIHEGMRQAVEPGNTAQALNVYGIEVAGKTGTAETGAQKEFINSLVVGFFPYDEPRFAFAVVMERAKAGTGQGAPAVMRSVLEWIVEHKPEMAQ
jgi:penicillin-binding protein 2